MAVILVTGSEGTLGTKLVEELKGRGHEVFGLDLQHSSTPNSNRADIKEARQVERVFAKVKPELCFALAAEFGRTNGTEYHEQLWGANCVGHQNIIDACIKHGTHMVFASSSEAYGTTADDGVLHEDVLLTKVTKHHNNYALSKYVGEKMMEIAITNDGLSGTILRFFNAYSEEKYNPYRSVICIWIYCLLHDMPVTVYDGYSRIFLHTSDWSRTVANVVDRYKGLRNGEVINIAGEEYVSVNVVMEKLLALVPESKSVITLLPKEKANITNKRADGERARKLLDHKCLVNLDEGLPQAVEWQRRKYGKVAA